jgi:CPA1 family monovalent cation:H+ antiporter
VLIGLILVPLAQIPSLNPLLGFLTDVVLTPELLFYIFLPMLIFESAFNMDIRKMIDSMWSISLLSVAGLVVSATLIATAIYFILPLVGLPIPFIVALLFGSIISSTDPVAVLALFKEFGAPKRLTMILEGESLFNDGTAVALFLVVLSVATGGFHGFETIASGLGTFLLMVLLGIAFGIMMAIIFSRGLRYTKSNEFVSITLLIVSAHIVFILCELINEHPIFGIQLHISSIIATTVSSLFLGNYTRHSLSPKSDEYLNKSIEHLAFVANSLVFLLAGLLFASTEIDLAELSVPIIITILIVALSRMASVYLITKPLNMSKKELIPESWQMLLAWGSLRGALAIIVVLLVPDDLDISGWSYAYSVKELLIALTIGCILATLFIKALTIGPLIK